MKTKYDHDVLLRWRSQLTDFEQDTLLPQLAGRLNILKTMFDDILSSVDKAEKDPAFILALQKVVDPTNVGLSDKQVPPHAEYCTKIRNQVQESFLGPISILRDSVPKIRDYRTFAKFINELMIVASSAAQNEKLFWLNIKPYAHIVNPKTEKLMATTEPVEYAIILRPFDILMKNISQMADGTIRTVEAWSKEQSNWKTQYLAFRSNESDSKNSQIVLMVNIATVFVAVSVSLSFLFLPDVWTSKKEKDQIKAEKQIIEKSLDQAKARISMLEAQLVISEKGKKHN
jgi:hypothetical protein